jgi:hypothetical protein
MPSLLSGVVWGIGKQASEQAVACNEARQQKTEEATGMAALLRLLWVRV